MKQVVIGNQARRSAFQPGSGIAALSLALRGIDADFGPEHADTFRRDLRADRILTTGLGRPCLT